MKQIKLATTSLGDKTLFKPTASASTGSGGPCNEHRQKAKSCRLNYEILMFHCFTVTICRINTSSALWFSDTQWQQLRQWWGSKMPLNHVEPFHFATQLLTAWKDLVQTLHLPRQSLQKVATPAGSQALRIPRYGIQKFNVSRCFNDFQGFSMIFNVCFTCTRWHVKVSGSFMFSWNYWLMMGMSYEQNTMGKGPNLSPWGLVNKRPRQKMWERRRHRKPWALSMRREMRRVAWRKVARW